jgi:hypothetical protein
MSEFVTPETTGAEAVSTVPMHEDYVTIDLDSGTVHRSFLDHVLCQNNKQANAFGVKLTKGGKAATVPQGSTCAGYFIKPDGNTVVIQGQVNETLPDGEADRCWVVLPQECYVQSGKFTLAINLHFGNYTTTVRIVDGTIVKTQVGEPIDPGIPIPDIDELLSIIAAAQGNTYDASTGVTLSGATFKLTKAVRQQLNAIRGINIDQISHAPDNEIWIDAASRTSGWVAMIWHCGTGDCYGIKFAHIAQDQQDETHYYASIINLVQSGTDHCQLEFDDDADDPCWHITNTHPDAHLRAIFMMSHPGDTFV